LTEAGTRFDRALTVVGRPIDRRERAMRLQERSSTWGRGERKPAWWALYGIAALLLAVVGLLEAYVEVGLVRRILECLAVLAGFGSIQLWLRSNRIALDLAQQGPRR
jgi:hypothetical protein